MALHLPAETFTIRIASELKPICDRDAEGAGSHGHTAQSLGHFQIQEAVAAF